MSEQIIEIPLVDLHDSPTNPRQSYAEAGLQELAADIRQHGRVLQPLLVRPRVPALFQGSGEEEAATCGYEVVFGHRRRRAAELAGLEKVHCMVRVMTDVQVRAAQISENLQRQDVTALEEAEGYRGLMDAECISVDEVCRRFGKSSTYVYGRLKLLNLVPDVRQALAAGEVEPEVATLIARLPHQKLQAQALTRIKNKMGESHIKDGWRASFRRVRELLRDEFTLLLDTALLQGIRPGPYSFDEPATTLDTWEQYYATGTLPALAASTPPPAGASDVEDDADAEETPPDADPAEPSQPHQPAAAGGVEAHRQVNFIATTGHVDAIPSTSDRRFTPVRWPFPRSKRGDEAQGDLLGSASEEVKDATGCAGEDQTDDAGVSAGGSAAEVDS